MPHCDVAADIVAGSFGKTVTDDFKKLWMAYPRGRALNFGPQKWAIGFGGDGPKRNWHHNYIRVMDV